MEQLGIDARLLIAQIINFLILLVLLGKFVYKPLLKLMEDRKKRIEQGLDLAARMEEEKAKLDEKTQEVLDRAQERATEILNRAKAQGEEEREAILEEARSEASKVIEEGLKVLQARQEEAQEELRRDLADLVVSLSEKLLAEKIDRPKHKKIIERQIEELKKQDVGKIH